MQRYKWDTLNNHQAGTYAEYFVKMEFTMYGFQVYTSEVDDRGIDFVCRHANGPYIEVQVKSLRNTNYVFMRKEHFKPHDNLYLALVILVVGKAPGFYLIPSSVWLSPDAVFVDRAAYEKPEWGLNISQKNMSRLKEFEFNTTMTDLMENQA